MSASWMGSANRFAVICPNVVEVRICTAISQANVSHSALMLGSLWAFRLVSVLNLSMYVVISVSVPICTRIQAHWMASKASIIIMDVCGSQSLVSCCTRVLLLVSIVSVLSNLSLFTVALTVPVAVNVRFAMISPSVTAV